MKIVDLIKKKRDGFAHTYEELEFIVKGTVSGEIKDYQISAWLMAAFIQGLDIEETTHLTKLVAFSGETLDLSSVKGIKVDKHSTGGVGDKVTLVLAPLVASADVVVAKLSGRGLGHTGGTVDKLEAIPNLKTSLKIDEFLSQLSEIGVSVIGQTQNLTPADKIFYALRDVTGTIDSLPLITVSVISKKIAAGADVILIDVKYGSGAFMKTFEDARKLSEMMVLVGKNLGKSIITAISNMEQPLGYSIGHTLEVIESIDTLKGQGPKDLTEICLKYGGLLLMKANRVSTMEEGMALLKENMFNGKAINKFREFIKAQGGDINIIENYKLMPQAEHIVEVKSDESGYVSDLVALSIAESAKILGAGRTRKEDSIDLGVGVKLNAKIGDKVNKGDVLAYIYANDMTNIESSINSAKSAFKFSPEKPEEMPLIREII